MPRNESLFTIHALFSPRETMRPVSHFQSIRQPDQAEAPQPDFLPDERVRGTLEMIARGISDPEYKNPVCQVVDLYLAKNEEADTTVTQIPYQEITDSTGVEEPVLDSLPRLNLFRKIDAPHGPILVFPYTQAMEKARMENDVMAAD